MVRTLRTLLPPLCALVALATVQGQSLPEHVAAVNDAFGGNLVARIDGRQRLVLDLYDEGVRQRQDVAPVAALDPASVTFSPSGSTILVGCREGYRHCLARESFKWNTTHRANNSILPSPPGDPSGERAIAALKALLVAAGERLAEMPRETGGRH